MEKKMTKKEITKKEITKKELTWCAIGDSFTYLDSHLDETGFRVKKGYLGRTLDLLSMPVRVVNLGINGSATTDWVTQELVKADFYTILLGTNDWFSRHTPLGTAEDYDSEREGTILGNLSCLIGNIRRTGGQAPVFVMNPVERGDFVCISDPDHRAHGSDRKENGLWLWEVSAAIFGTVRGTDIYPIDLHSRAGITQENVAGMTYDGLHPSDKGCDSIARVLSEEINHVMEAY